ncbi:hypothetical protein Goklo_025319, partial [Gossypium klotzschianum]|nr:hypothetical protein [Gossypium klotzschianum]
AVTDGNIRESGDIDGGIEKIYLFGLIACPPRKGSAGGRVQQPKEHRMSRGLGTRVPVPNPSATDALLELLPQRERVTTCRSGDGLVHHQTRIRQGMPKMRFISNNYDRCIDWLEDLMRVLDNRAMADLMTILWNCWNNRNNFIFRGKEEEAKQIWERASENRCGYGTVIRDEKGFVLGGGGRFKEGRMSVEEAECMAFEESIKVACNLNLKDQVIFETDHVGLVNKFNKLAHDFTTIGARLKECTAAFSLFKSANLIWTERSSNTVVHLICKKMCGEAKHCLFEMDYPPEIHN